MYIDPIYGQFILPLIIATFLAINMGVSGTAPSFAAAYGANLIPKNLIPGLFGIMVFIGAIIAGKNVAITLGQGFLPQESMSILLTSIILLAVALSLLLANLLGVPQSTSQSTVFALSGPAIYFGHFESNKLFIEIIPTWFVLPFISFGIAYFAAKLLLMPNKRWSLLEFETLRQHPGLQALVIFSSLYVAFSIGANNVANASGPVASMIIHELGLGENEENFALIMVLSTLVIAPAFGIGSSLMGKKVIQRTGKEIVELGPVSATLISFITASLLLSVSVLRGIPASLVQLNTGAILAIGCAKHGWKEIFSKSSVKKFWVVWIVAPILAFILSISMTWIAHKMGLLVVTW